MHSIILTGVHDYDPILAICRSGPDLRGALAAWFADLVPDLDFAEADPQTIEDGGRRSDGPLRLDRPPVASR